MEDPKSRDQINSALQDAQMSQQIKNQAQFETTKLIGNLLTTLGYLIGVIAPFLLMLIKGSISPLILILVPVLGTIIPTIWFNSSGNIFLKVISIVLVLITNLVMSAGLESGPFFYWIIPISLFIGFWITQRKIPKMEKEIN
ncbi:hypothetical protein [Prochlorococcus marinus]|uniref:hypothetical protein n=1 Tax=Prochlorococcus marinus TaxID=1219 RepID=UPI001ADBCFCC|nr:hypothetical protein [Prochlorococcus marinus]MBO8204752.1 hypothetical protein [Prochlorococcus marinus CUG1415]MBW3044040.1 hypothetical protein [Prochlorococcus marinus str. MU1415]